MEDYPRSVEGIPELAVSDGRYRLRFLRDAADLERVLRLRFEVFNLELGEGLESSFETGLDRDEYDRYCHHLAVEDVRSGAIVGTYRMQTSRMAENGAGLYTAEEFDLSEVPAEVLADSVELGRACIDREHRNTQVLYLLWKGLAAYITHNSKRYLFGCCSLTSLDPEEGRQVMAQIEREGLLDDAIRVSPRTGMACYPHGISGVVATEVRLPRLFRTYLRFGAKVCGEPAIDRRFGTIDYLVVFDTAKMDDHMRRMFFE